MYCESIGMNHPSPQLDWLTDDIDWYGYATTENVYAEDDKEKSHPVGRQIQFAGTFPADNPRFTICVVADKSSLDVEPSVFKEVVNPLVRFLKVYKAR